MTRAFGAAVARVWWWLWLLPAGIVFWCWLMVVLVWRGPSVALSVLVDSLEQICESD